MSAFKAMKPTGCGMVDADTVLVSMEDAGGRTLDYTMSTRMLVKLVNMATTMMNENLAQVLRDLNVFR